MGLINIVGDLYHKNVYRHISNVTGRITDLTDFCITDLALAPYLFIHEILLGAVGHGIYRYVSADTDDDAAKVLIGVASALAIVGATVTLTSFGNLARTPIQKKLALQPTRLDKEREMKYAIQRLNELSDSEPLSFEQVSERTNQAIDDYVERTEGYKVNHARKAKISYFSKILSQVGLVGLVNPFIHELVITTPKMLESIAHERAHQVGYVREEEAQFVGYAAMLESGDRSLGYLAYRQRLDMLMDQKMFDNLESTGLNERTREELIDQCRDLEEGFSRLSRYRQFKMKIGLAFRSLFLRSSGQGNIETAYINKPLGLISAYDPPT